MFGVYSEIPWTKGFYARLADRAPELWDSALRSPLTDSLDFLHDPFRTSSSDYSTATIDIANEMWVALYITHHHAIDTQVGGVSGLSYFEETLTDICGEPEVAWGLEVYAPLLQGISSARSLRTDSERVADSWTVVYRWRPPVTDFDSLDAGQLALALRWVNGTTSAAVAVAAARMPDTARPEPVQSLKVMAAAGVPLDAAASLLTLYVNIDASTLAQCWLSRAPREFYATLNEV